MTLFSKFFIVSSAFLSTLAQCNDIQDKFNRGDSVIVEQAGLQFDAQLFLTNESEQTYQTPFYTLLDGRSLLDSWMGKRQETCLDTGYSPCPGNSGCCPSVGFGCCPLGCCPTGKTCCTNANVCANPGSVCCAGYTCPSGWNCCTQGTCYPDGGQCCSTGFYCNAGNVCVLVDGAQKCCTDDRCTAHVSDSVTLSIPAPQTNTDNTLSIAPPATTAAPTQATLSVIFTYYYYTITYYYVSWYWTVYLEESSSTYTTITTYTTISIYETNSNAAYSSFLDVSETLSLSTPEAASTLSPLPENTAAASSSSPQAGGGGVGVTVSFSNPVPSSTSTSRPTSSQSRTGSSSETTSKVPGSGSEAMRLKAGWGASWGSAGLVGMWFGVGGLMVWL